MKVKFVPQNVEFEIKPNESVMHVAQDHGIYIKSVCKGVPSCAECRVRLVEGEHNVLPPGSEELSLIGTGHFIDRRRLSCQLKCFGDITVDMNEQIAKENGTIVGRKKRSAIKDDRVEQAVVRRSEDSPPDTEEGSADQTPRTERPPRSERPPREDRGPRPPREDRGARPPREDRGARPPRDDRPQRDDRRPQQQARGPRPEGQPGAPRPNENPSRPQGEPNASRPQNQQPRGPRPEGQQQQPRGPRPEGQQQAGAPGEGAGKRRRRRRGKGGGGQHGQPGQHGEQGQTGQPSRPGPGPGPNAQGAITQSPKPPQS